MDGQTWSVYENHVTLNKHINPTADLKFGDTVLGQRQWSLKSSQNNTLGQNEKLEDFFLSLLITVGVTFPSNRYKVWYQV